MNAKGWAVKSDMEISIDGTTVELGGVCTCGWHKHCESSKRCASLFDYGGEDGAIRTLKRLMGKKFPRSWAGIKPSWKSLCDKRDKQEEFEREYFKKCRPVMVEIYGNAFYSSAYKNIFSAPIVELNDGETKQI